ncbi:hypothetical protein K9B32_16425 [Rhizobium sp. 3T7]|uniref:hypothetical protein n=1 Tax=Rhizobium sp. 3T7 TaxID=2874922 RepID=UPI001CC97089|nr:hypothetical protein [Rhizobium sp. 3T7]MBZ9791692.1 hypothetical protein [Rhizobium sp. 3T7]
MTQFQIEVVEDDDNVGSALITFRGKPPQLAGAYIGISRRSPDLPWLGENGWQAPAAALPVTVVSQADGWIVFRAGPEVCAYVQVDAKVRIDINGTSAFGHAFWPSITHVGGNRRQSPVIDRVSSQPAVASLPAPEALQPAVETIQPPPPRILTETAVAAAVQQRQSRRGLWLALSVVVLAAVAAAAIVERRPLGALVAGLTHSETLAERFEKLKRGDAAGDGLLQLSRDAYEQGDKTIGMEAMALSVERGNAIAKIEMAKWYDPRTAALDKVAGIDANKAARAFFELAMNGNHDASSLLASLCQESGNAGSAYARSFSDFLGTTYCEGSLGE